MQCITRHGSQYACRHSTTTQVCGSRHSEFTDGFSTHRAYPTSSSHNRYQWPWKASSGQSHGAFQHSALHRVLATSYGRNSASRWQGRKHSLLVHFHYSTVLDQTLKYDLDVESGPASGSAGTKQLQLLVSKYWNKR